MEIKDVFTIVKADRYTDAGRAEIDDARRTYKPGEISETIGLQKQSNGTWAPPKKGGSAAGATDPQRSAESKPAAENKTKGASIPAANHFEEQPKKNEYSDFKTKHDLNVSGKSPEEADSYMKENGFELQPESRQDYRVYRNKYGEEVTSHYDDKGNYQGGSQTPAKIPGKDNHRAYAEAKGNKYIGQGKTAFGTVQVYETPEGKVEMADFNEAGEYTGGSTSSKEFYKKWYDFDLEDAAPRALTGDCKVRVKK